VLENSFASAADSQFSTFSPFRLDTSSGLVDGHVPMQRAGSNSASPKTGAPYIAPTQAQTHFIVETNLSDGVRRFDG
jgi:hypothetical protein